ncbi:MAG: hypothetical protein FJ299_01920 [Planctomycetes bacterium]|nr:hypothetical protein [Planctomycetota bacterium]
MSAASQPVCMTCGHSAGAPLRFNHLPNGDPCPSCADRLLEALRPLLPGVKAVADEKKPARNGRKAALRALPRIPGPIDRAEPEPA